MKLKSILLHNLQGRKILVFFLLASAIYLVMIVGTIEHLILLADGYKPLDMLPLGYNQEYVKTLLDKLDVSGRQYYLNRQLPLDFLYPALFAITYSLLFAYLLKKINKQNSRSFYLAYLPILAGAADYVENLSIIYFINAYPNISESSVHIASFFSVTKSVATSLYYASLVVLLVVFARHYLISKNRKPAAPNIT